MDQNAKLMFNYLHDILYNPQDANLNLEELTENFIELGRGLQYMAACIKETALIAKALSKGNMNISLPSPENEIAAPLKDLHAKMKHITWQAQQISQGEFNHNIDYMGEFGEAFNTMTRQLKYQRESLLEEIEKGRKKRKALEQNNSLLETITNKIPQWIIVTSALNSQWLFINQHAKIGLQDSKLEITLRNWMIKQADELCGNGEVSLSELEYRDIDGIKYFTVEIHPLNWHEQNAFAFIFTDISHEKKQLDNLQNIAYTDVLTRLYNRTFGMKALNKYLSENKSFILCFVDIDNLKYVNDRLGHVEGDKYLITVANILRRFSENAILCRIGGDEFMLLAENWDENGAKERLEALRAELIKCNINKHDRYERSISYGIISISEDNDLPMEDLLSMADEKMYEYKRAYKNKNKKRRNGS